MKYNPYLVGIVFCLVSVLFALLIYSEYAKSCVSCTEQELENAWAAIGFIPVGSFLLGFYFGYTIQYKPNKLKENK